MEKTKDDVMAAAFLLLAMKGLISVKEFNEVRTKGYDGVWRLLNQKYEELKLVRNK